MSRSCVARGFAGAYTRTVQHDCEPATAPRPRRRHVALVAIGNAIAFIGREQDRRAQRRFGPRWRPAPARFNDRVCVLVFVMIFVVVCILYTITSEICDLCENFVCEQPQPKIFRTFLSPPAPRALARPRRPAGDAPGPRSRRSRARGIGAGSTVFPPIRGRASRG